ncbi:Glutathione transport system permease protein GsiC [compost metagenome]
MYRFRLKRDAHMAVYLLKRIFALVPVLLLVSVFVFLLLRLTPGDPAAILAGDAATTEQLERIREAMGLNEPILIQYFTWMGKILQGDLGVSLISGVPVLDMVSQRIGPTISIAVLTIIIAVLAAIPMGVIAAWRHRSWIDYLVMSFSVLGFSVPVFLVGYVLLLIFSVNLGWLPVQGFKPISSGFGGFMERAILPALTLASIYIALIARMTRAAMLDVLGEDYIRTARAKGVSDRRLLFVHALKNAAVPVVTIVGTGFALLISGVVVTESIFNIPGIGRLTVDAVLARDYPVIQAMILLTSALYVFVNLLIDLSYTLFDPRIRY